MSERHRPIFGIRRDELDVRRIPHAEASKLIAAHHYARGCSNTSTDAYGLFRDDHLVGAAVWLPPTRACAETVDKVEWRRVISLSRLAVVPEVGTNAASIFIAAMLRDLRQEGRWVSAVTFADESQGHHGGIYAATNWVYEGRTKPEPRWVDEDGKQVSRLSTKSRAAFVMEILGHRVEGRFSKHRYTMRLAAYPPLERPPSPPAWRRAFRRLGVRS